MIPLSSPTSVLLAGGGSAGHVSPLLALADALRRRHPDLRVTALGTQEGLEARLVPARGYDLRFVPKVPLPRRPSVDLLRLPGRLKAAVDAAGAAIDESGAEVVVGFGGYVSTPAYLAARRRRVPIVIHEQNTTAGIANRLGARWATAVATTFASTSLRGARRIGMPLRHEVATLDRAARRDEALAHFGLEPSWPTRARHRRLPRRAAPQRRLACARRRPLSRAGVQVLHVTGLGKEFAGRDARRRGARTSSSPTPTAWSWRMPRADLVVARAGANTVCELTAVGLPAVYVPLPVGNGEQRLNASEVVAAGGGLLVDDAAFTPAWVDAQLLPLAADAARLGAMAAAARALGEPAADEALADLVDERRRRQEEPVNRTPRTPTVDDPFAAARFDFRAPVPSAADLGRVHFLAIGGAGMSGVARIMLARGIRVTGSDAKDVPVLKALESEGAGVWVGFHEAHQERADAIVMSSSIRDDNVELVAARERGVPVLHRAQGLAALMQGRRPVAVAGANGKTTTTSMLTVALQGCGLDPSFAVGGELAKHGTNAHDGADDVFVVEADESDGSFVVYGPEVAIVTNVQPDHLDFYLELQGCAGGLRRLRRHDPPRRAARHVRGRRRRRGAGRSGPAQPARACSPTASTPTPTSCWPTTVRTASRPRSTLRDAGVERRMTLGVPGRHNALNAAAAYAAAVHGLGQDPDRVLAGLASFTGTRRRFEPKGEAGGVVVVDDYAHNAGKVAAVVETAKDLVGDSRPPRRRLPAAPLQPDA